MASALMGQQWSSGISRPGWNRKAEPVPVLAAKRKPNVNRRVRSRYATNERAAEPGKSPGAPVAHGEGAPSAGAIDTAGALCSSLCRPAPAQGAAQCAIGRAREGNSARPVRSAAVIPVSPLVDQSCVEEIMRQPAAPRVRVRQPRPPGIIQAQEHPPVAVGHSPDRPPHGEPRQRDACRSEA